VSTPAWILEIFGAAMLLVAEVSAGQLVAACTWTRHRASEARASEARGADVGIAVSQLLTGIALASILVPGLSFLPHTVWQVAFAVMTAWFAWCLWRERRGRGASAGHRPGVAGGRHAPHLVQSAAMLYLFAALAGPNVAESGMSASFTGGMAGMPGMAGGSSGGTPALHASSLALVFVLLLVAYAVHDLDRRAGLDDYFQVPGGRRLVPGGSTPPAASTAAAAGHVARGQAAYAQRLLLSPTMVKGCQVATGVTMAFILIILI
jgi:hypothetical protein